MRGGLSIFNFDLKQIQPLIFLEIHAKIIISPEIQIFLLAMTPMGELRTANSSGSDFLQIRVGSRLFYFCPGKSFCRFFSSYSFGRFFPNKRKSCGYSFTSYRGLGSFLYRFVFGMPFKNLFL
jgi:hypothetical protein